jgi:MSHA biogenesis protein MshK
VRKRIGLQGFGLPLAIAFACAFAQAEAQAQMRDPMRPADALAAPSGPAAAPVSSGLQAVITSPRRKLALIDGAVVPVGSPVREATLTGVSDSLAVLQKNGERDVLLMHPSIDKKPARRERP